MKVELVAKTVGVGKYEDLTSEEIISAIARHGVIKEDNGKLVKYLMDNKHWSPLDMINFVFEIETSRAIGRQLLRHFSIKTQEHSQRYSDRVLFEDIEFRKEHPTNRQSSTELVFTLFPKTQIISYNSELEAEWDKIDLYSRKVRAALNNIEELYKEGINLGLAKECVRMILPECTTTTLSFNGTLRSWLSLLNVRMEEHTQKEAKEIANLVGLELERELPNVFSKINWKNGLFL